MWTPPPDAPLAPHRHPAIHRYEVPVDDQWHEVELTGDIVHVAARTPYAVEVWAHAGIGSPCVHEFRVFGTGQPLPTGHGGAPLRHVGTALVGRLAWHLMQRMAGHGDPGEDLPHRRCGARGFATEWGSGCIRRPHADDRHGYSDGSGQQDED